MTAEERAKVIHLLEQSRDEFFASVEGLTDQQWNYHPGPDSWSVGETAEHIVLAETSFFGAIQRALKSTPHPGWEAEPGRKSMFIERVMINRTRRAQAPKSIHPRGLPRAEVLDRYLEVRTRTLKFARETQLALREFTADHPFPVFNTLSAYDWLLYIPMHNLRHNAQIVELLKT
jgi:uncharacterized damage-inducible protein DinB